ncbi:MAG: tetratricopeptide repeat protein, partial [Anaerolineales bacterium]|nr:tetratricopeptide repeat protein [Anaerolineales bacterium]
MPQQFRIWIRILLFGGMVWGLGACNTLRQLPFLNTPTPTVTFTPSPTATPLPTSTPPPTPTPLPAARIDAGEDALFLGDWEGARQAFLLALQNPAEPEIEAAAMFGLARVQYTVGEFSNVLDTLRQLSDKYPDYPRTYFLLGRTYADLQRYTEAGQAFERYLQLAPGVIDRYALEWLGDARFAAGDYSGAADAFSGAAEAAGIVQNEEMLIKLGQAYTFAGDTTSALAVYDSIYLTTNNDFYRAQVNLLRGEIYTLLGQPEVAYDLYQESAAKYPYAASAYLGMIRLVDAGVAVNEFDRGLVDYYAGEYGLAIAAFDRFLADETIPHDGAAHYYKGMALRDLGDYTGAIAAWDALITTHLVDDPFWASAWEEKGYTQWAYLDDYETGISTFLTLVEQAPDYPRAGEFLFFAGQVAERDGQLTRAAEIWERLTEEYPNDPIGVRASFLAGIAHYRLGEYSGALPAFQRALNRATDPAEKAAAALWLGKARAALKLEDEARLAWEEAASYDPTGYYSERALELLDGQAPFVPPEIVDYGIDWEGERRAAIDWLDSVFPVPEGTDLTGLGTLPADPRFVRGTELWHLGLYEAARTEFEDLRLSFRDDPVLNFQLANYLLDLGLYRTAIFCARQVLTLAGMDDATTMGAPLWFNHVRFGLYYQDLITGLAKEYDLHPLLLWSLVRQESLFEGFVRSSAGARGLMQIMPATGEGIYNNLGWPEGYTSEDLYRPVINIPFGVDYLADQLVYLDGDIYAALAGYNGGPGNARAWQTLAGG